MSNNDDHSRMACLPAVRTRHRYSLRNVPIEEDKPLSSATDLMSKCVSLSDKAKSAIIKLVADTRSESGSESLKKAVQVEGKFWNTLQTFKQELKDKAILSYLVGFYSSLQTEVLVKYQGSRKGQLDAPVSVSSLRLKPSQALGPQYSADSELGHIRLLIYNVLIRQGDLNRYQSQKKVAQNFYMEAQQLNPLRGHAFNQLALITSQKDFFNLLYYYVRAVTAIEEPTLIAKNNIDSIVKKTVLIDPLMKLIFEAEGQTDTSKIDFSLVTNWLQLVVIAKYAQNLKAIAHPIVSLTKEWLRKHNVDPFQARALGHKVSLDDDSSQLLIGFDLFLDCQLSELDVPTMSSLEMEMQILRNETTQLISQIDTFAINSDLIALKHNYELIGAKFLRKQNAKLNYLDIVPSGANQESLKVSDSFSYLITKINDKIQKLIFELIASHAQPLACALIQLDSKENSNANSRSASRASSTPRNGNGSEAIEKLRFRLSEWALSNS